jgi:D-glycero-D-manno-heptose 1,7-bisphosphate phosphatase
MKAVFLSQNAVLRDSHLSPDSDAETWRLSPATLEAVRLLGGQERLLFLLGACCREDGAQEAGDAEALAHRMHRVVSQIEAGGGRVDATLACSHRTDDPCRCWGGFPGALWVAASQLNLRLEDAYLLADSPREVQTAIAAGARPLVVLGGRRIAELFGDAPPQKDFPIAEDLGTAVDYIAVEEDISAQWAQPRQAAILLPAPKELYADPKALPRLNMVSKVAQGLQAQAVRTRAQLQDIVRWLSFVVVGAMGLSLGVAYLLTHLYRVQAFPPIVYYLTLQFISRPLRGGLFILLGLGIITIALQRWVRSVRNPLR